MPSQPAAPLREALVDTSAITENTRTIRDYVGTDVLAVVKADAYGHGAVRTARAALAGGATLLGVTDLSEAHELRDAGIDAPILSWLHTPGADFVRAVERSITLGISTRAQLEEAAAAATAGRPTVVHLKLETGLSRNGFARDEWDEIFALAAGEDRLVVEGIFSHLSNTSDEDDRAALALYLEGVAAAEAAGLNPRFRHIAATAAAIMLPEARLDLVRIGIGLHGLSPDPSRIDAAALGLRPSMTLRGVVANVRRVPAGTGASYGYTYRTDRETTLALVPLGYADGVPRQASNLGPVSINGRTYRVSGRIAMDQFIVDVGDDEVAIGDEAVLFGASGPTAEQWAEAADTINYEIVTRVGARVPRVEVP